MIKTLLTISIAFLMLCSSSGLKAQTTISTDYHKMCWWNSETDEVSTCQEYRENSIIYINKDETEVSITTQKGEREFKVLKRNLVQDKSCKSYMLKQGTFIISLLIYYEKNIAVELFRQEGNEYIRTIFNIKTVYKL